MKTKFRLLRLLWWNYREFKASVKDYDLNPDTADWWAFMKACEKTVNDGARHFRVVENEIMHKYRRTDTQRSQS